MKKNVKCNMKKLLIVSPIIFIGIFFFVFSVNASLAPQVYLTNINIQKNDFDPGENIEGFVTLLNYENLVVSDLVFHFQIVSHEIDGVATKIIDEQISVGTFTLSSGREVRKVFDYVLPSNLPKDNFKFRVQLANSRGEEMAWIDKIISVGGDGKFLTLDNYWIIKDGKKLVSGAGVTYGPGQIPEIEFDIINSSSFSIDAFPKVITYKRNVNDVFEEQKGNPIILKPDEKKTQKLFLPKLTKPETYLSEVRFYDNKTEEAISNPIYFRWIISGEDVEILFVKPDKMSYKAGEKANIEIQIAGPPNYYILETNPKGVLVTKILNENGNIVGESRKEIELIDDTIIMSILIRESVDIPEIRTSIIKDGRIIDEYNFKVVPESQVIFEDIESKLGFWIWFLRVVLTIVILTFIVIFIYHSKIKNSKMKKINALSKLSKLRKNKKTIKNILLLIFFGVGFLAFNVSGVLAAVEISGGCKDTLMIFNTPLPNRIYNVNDVVNFSGKYKSTGASSSSFFNKISFYITEDMEVDITDCCGDIYDECGWKPVKTCRCKEGYINYYGASSSFYDYQTNKSIKWFNEVKGLNEEEQGVYKIGAVYPSDTIYGDPWVAFNQSFIIPDNLEFSGPVRFYVEYSGTHWRDHWQWSITYQNSWINENKPPYVDSIDFNGPLLYCEVGEGKGRIGLKWNYQDHEGDKQAQYHLQVANDSIFNKENLVIDTYSSVVKGDPAGSTNTSPSIMVVNEPNPEGFEIGYNSKYWWRVKVQDEKGYWSQWRKGPEFTTPVHAYPYPKFTWTSENSMLGKIISFVDNGSKCYRDDGSDYLCKDERREVNYEWDFDYEPLEGFTTDSVKTDLAKTYSEQGQYIVRLRLVDEAGSCFSSSNIEIKEEEIHPPGWKPRIPGLPSDLLDNLSSMISVFFR